MSRLEAARQMAAKAHAGQMRKGLDEPYIMHPERVAAQVGALGYSVDLQIAALLHDTLEDTTLTPEEISGAFGQPVLDAVVAMTNPSKGRPELPRAERKVIDREHMASVSPEVATVKALDRADNLSQLDTHSQNFIELYTRESIELAKVLDGKAHPRAMEALWGQISRLLIS